MELYRIVKGREVMDDGYLTEADAEAFKGNYGVGFKVEKYIDND